MEVRMYLWTKSLHNTIPEIRFYISKYYIVFYSSRLLFCVKSDVSVSCTETIFTLTLMLAVDGKFLCCIS